MTLRSELLQKSASYSKSHPDMKAIKQKLAALEKLVAPVQEAGVGLDALQRTQEAIQKELQSNSQRLSAARLGESLERGQQSEKLEVIEQPTLPQKPIRPKREKLLAMVLAFAAAAGGGLVFLLEAMEFDAASRGRYSSRCRCEPSCRAALHLDQGRDGGADKAGEGARRAIAARPGRIGGRGILLQDELAPMVDLAVAKVRR